MTFDNGVVEGDHISKAGSLQVDLHVAGDEIRGEMKNGEESTKIFLKRAVDPGVAPQAG